MNKEDQVGQGGGNDGEGGEGGIYRYHTCEMNLGNSERSLGQTLVALMEIFRE